MSSVRGTLRAYLELSRISNLPTCVTNVLVGVAIGAGAGPLPWTTVAVVVVAVGLLYVAGMAFNDAFDASVDRARRPERPIPSGRVTRAGAFVYAGATMGVALVLIATFARPAWPWAAGLAAAIIAYDALHHRLAAAVVLMGVCRGLVYILSAAAVTGDRLDWSVAGPVCLAMTLYVLVVTALARREHRPSPASWRLADLVLPLLVLSVAVIGVPAPPARWAALAAAVLVGVWLGWCHRLRVSDPPRLQAAVMGWLAGICLADGYFLTLLQRPALAVIALVCFGLTTMGHRTIAGS